MNACVGWGPDQWLGYTEGYKRAGDLLVQHVCDNLRDQDFLIFPIVFSYRQAIEVSLKHSIWLGCKLLDKPNSLKLHHRLLDLWKDCRSIIEEVWKGEPSDKLDAIGNILRQFEERDPTSTVFRYPVTREGRPSIPSNGRIDIQQFSEIASECFQFLDVCTTALGEYLQSKWEMERAARDNYY